MIADTIEIRSIRERARERKEAEFLRAHGHLRSFEWCPGI